MEGAFGDLLSEGRRLPGFGLRHLSPELCWAGTWHYPSDHQEGSDRRCWACDPCYSFRPDWIAFVIDRARQSNRETADRSYVAPC